MPSTPEYGLRYPSLADAPNGPDAVQDLAEDVESTLQTIAPVSAATINVKGDLLAGTANDTVARLAVGTDGEVLTADSGAPTGLTWTTRSTVAAGTATVDSPESTTSTVFTDLTTPGPAVSVDVGPQGVAVVSIAALVDSLHKDETSGEWTIGVVSFAVTGANSLAASALHSISANAWIIGAGGDWLTTNVQGGATYVLTGLASGSTTFTLKYRCNDITGEGGDALFNRRSIGVVTF